MAGAGGALLSILLRRQVNTEIEQQIFSCFIFKVHEHRTERSDLSFLEQEEGGGRSTSTDSCVQELEAAHAETILELEKARHLLITESKISQDYKVSPSSPSSSSYSSSSFCLCLR